MWAVKKNKSSTFLSKFNAAYATIIMKNLGTLLTLCIFFPAFAQTPCEEGFAGSYDCKGLDLQSRIQPFDLGAEEHEGSFLNDIWGWYDSETGREYALVGMVNGTSFVDVTDPVNPVVLGVLPEHNSIETGADDQLLHDGAKSTWRDIKVYGNYAYVVSEDEDHGVQVFDLTQLRDVSNPSVDNLFGETGHYDGVGNAHNININEETGFLYVVGFDQPGNFTCNGGGLHIVNLSDPANPTYEACFDDDGYTHDTQCVIYQGPDADYQGREICFSSNEEDIVVTIVDDKGDMIMLSKTTYDRAEYVHQGWLTEDHKYFLTNDELDEATYNQNTRTYIWDVQDLDSLILLGFFEHENQAIDHNLYVQGKYVYQSNYTNGLRVLDTVGIHTGSLREVAHFDTFVSSDATRFSGSWSNYPFLPSGNILVSDRTNGLFVVRFSDFFIAIEPEDITACVGAHINVPMEAIGEGLTYQWQINTGSGFEDITDFERYINTRTNKLHAHTLTMEQDGYQFRCIVSNGVEERITRELTLSVVDLPQTEAAFEYELVGPDAEYLFTNISTSADSYQWDFGDGATSMDESPVHQFDAAGLYNVELIASNLCKSDTLVNMVEALILSVDDGTSDLVVYPTIASDHVVIYHKAARASSYELQSLNGSVMIKGEIQGSRTDISTHSLKDGVYVLRVSIDEHIVTKKIIVK